MDSCEERGDGRGKEGGEGLGGLGKVSVSRSSPQGRRNSGTRGQMTAQLPGWGQEGGVRDSGPRRFAKFSGPGFS